MSGRYSELDLANRLVQNSSLRFSRENVAIARPVRSSRRGTQQKPKMQETPARPQAVLKAVAFTVLGSPVPKPRQTKRDKWAKRPCVMRYRAWADNARAVRNTTLRREFPDVRFLGEIHYRRIQAVAFFKMPGSWNAATKAKMRGQPHCLRPDADNLLKAIGDSLFPTGDEHLYDLQISKYWDDGNGDRTVITLY